MKRPVASQGNKGPQVRNVQPGLACSNPELAGADGFLAGMRL